jgi:hypothetical protein
MPIPSDHYPFACLYLLVPKVELRERKPDSVFEIVVRHPDPYLGTNRISLQLPTMTPKVDE